MGLRVLIVDDERLARSDLRSLLDRESDIEIVGEADGGHEAVKAIRKLKPDIVFLDIQMPGLDGFGVVKTIGRHRMPHVIFTTAHDQYTLRAFEIHALDYLLKPIKPDRLRGALARARHILWTFGVREEFQIQLQHFLKDVPPETAYLRRILIKSGQKIHILKDEEIEWVEAAGNYVVFHTSQGEHLLRETMHDLEKKLDPKRFVRANRSAIINLEAIEEIQPYFHGELVVCLRGRKTVVVSRTYQRHFRKKISHES